MNTSTHNTTGLTIARQRLSRFILEHAEAIRRHLGFGFIETEDAPETYTDLLLAWKRSILNREPLPVYSGASEGTIYTSPAVNWAFRFWHDVIHCQLRADFSEEGEKRTARAQLKTVADRFGADSLEYRLLEADTIGQVEYFAQHGGFVADQLAFVLERVGLAAAA